MNSDRPPFRPEMPEAEPIIPTAAELELATRRQLAVRALGHVAEILDVEVSVPNLLITAQEPEPSTMRLSAKRILRAVAAIGTPDSEVMQRVGEADIYHFLEGVVVYGAAQHRYLSLMSEYRLTAPEVTGLYALRELVAENTDGSLPGFQMLIWALRRVNVSLQWAALNPEEAAQAFDDAGYFVDHAGRQAFDRPKFWPGGGEIPLGRDGDTDRSMGALERLEWVRRFGESNRLDPLDDDEPEGF